MNEESTKSENDYFEIGKKLSIVDVKKIASRKVDVKLSGKAKKKIRKGRQAFRNLLEKGEEIYGVTTGVGALEDTERTPQPQAGKKILRSHAAGVGEPLEKEIVRSMMTLMTSSLATGHSGVRERVMHSLIEALNEDVYPFVPRKGSVGSSGDLAPSAHIALTLTGEGEVIQEDKRRKSREALSRKDLSPLSPNPREALALINGSYLMTSLSLFNITNATNLIASAEITTALAFEAFKAHKSPLNAQVHKLRPHPGQIQAAKNLRLLLRGSSLIGSRTQGVQDPYSFRCSPQVLGSARDTLSFSRETVEREINSITDNPILLWQEEPRAVSAGNFHGAPLAISQETLGTAIASLGNISERRTAKLMDENASRLPAFLIKNSGGNSGLMLAQYTSAALVAKNKVLSHPANVDSIPTSAGQEDFNNLGSISARKTKKIIENVNTVIAIEAICASQAIDLRGGTDKMGRGTRKAYEIIREVLPFLEEDEEPIYELINRAKKLIRSGRLVESISNEISSFTRPSSDSSTI